MRSEKCETHKEILGHLEQALPRFMSRKIFSPLISSERIYENEK